MRALIPGRALTWALAAVVLASVPAGASPLCDRHQQPAPSKSQARQAHHDGPFKWWQDGTSRGEMGITDQQSASIEQLWQASLPRLRAGRKQIDELENALSQMIRDASDEAAVSAQIDKLESVRSDFNKTRTLMLYRMNRVLSAEQRAKLKAMHDRWEASRRTTPK